MQNLSGFLFIIMSITTFLDSGRQRKRAWDKSLTLNIKSEQNEFSDTQNTVLFVFLSNLSIFKIYNKEFLRSKTFCPRLFSILFNLLLSQID